MKKPLFKRWTTYLYAFLAIVLLGIILPDPPEIEPSKVESAQSEEKSAGKKEVAAELTETEKATAEADAKAQAKKDEEAAARIAEITKRNEAEAAKKAAEQAQADADAKVTAAMAAEAEEEIMQDALQAVIALSEGVVVDIAQGPGEDWEIVYATISDAWYLAEEYEKERFAETYGAAIKAALNEKPTFVNFYDTYGKEVASEKMFGGYKIKR
ncbi:hypothetical protein [Sporosarcina koreensis]|uniref:hypothetical protein n=1 Tax=Sporosarcina koreensis TaxID=334735 RepID=UPI00075B9563|nr:hypothetical protein [Sporosarcina koreensis]